MLRCATVDEEVHGDRWHRAPVVAPGKHVRHERHCARRGVAREEDVVLSAVRLHDAHIHGNGDRLSAFRLALAAASSCQSLSLSLCGACAYLSIQSFNGCVIAGPVNNRDVMYYCCCFCCCFFVYVELLFWYCTDAQ